MGESKLEAVKVFTFEELAEVMVFLFAILAEKINEHLDQN